MNTADTVISIGELATTADVTVESLRYYEQRGLLKPAGRRHNGYREYDTSSVALLKFIKRAQSLGFTLVEVAELVKLREANWNVQSTRRLREATVAKVRDIDGRIAELRKLRRELATLIANCDASCSASSLRPGGNGRENDETLGEDGDCALVDALDSGTLEKVNKGSVKSPKPARRLASHARKPAHTNHRR